MSAPRTVARPLSLAAQYVAHLLTELPPGALAHPGSRETRLAIRDAANRTIPVLRPSRRELAMAMSELDRAGLLPTTSTRASELAYSLLDGVER